MWTWAEYVRRRRVALGLTQVGMEDWLGVGRRVVSAWEQGRNEPQQIVMNDHMRKIDRAYKRARRRARR